jgi:hypothetical protein
MRVIIKVLKQLAEVMPITSKTLNKERLKAQMGRMVELRTLKIIPLNRT